MLANFFRKKTPQLLGLDIGTRHIKAVLLEKKGDGYHLLAYACEPIFGNAFVEREIKEFDAVSNALKKVKMALKSKCKHAAIAVAGSSVISKVVHMEPDQTDFELEGQIEIEADSLIPHPLDEVYLDFEEIGASKHYAGKVDVLLSAAHKDMVDSRITLIREVPYEPKVIDIEGYALGNAIRLFDQASETAGDACCVHIGASLLQVCVLKAGEVIYSKEHQFGLDSLIKDLALIHTLEHQEAEKQLIEGTLPESWRQDVYPTFLANLQQSISRAMQVYMSSTQAARPETLLLAGGGSTIPGLVDDLSADLAVNVRLFNPFENMSAESKVDEERLKKIAPTLAIAAGLASRSFDTWHM